MWRRRSIYNESQRYYLIKNKIICSKEKKSSTSSPSCSFVTVSYSSIPALTVPWTAVLMYKITCSPWSPTNNEYLLICCFFGLIFCECSDLTLVIKTKILWKATIFAQASLDKPGCLSDVFKVFSKCLYHINFLNSLCSYKYKYTKSSETSLPVLL